jgi:hypothetical protein
MTHHDAIQIYGTGKDKVRELLQTVTVMGLSEPCSCDRCSEQRKLILEESHGNPKHKKLR